MTWREGKMGCFRNIELSLFCFLKISEQGFNGWDSLRRANDQLSEAQRNGKEGIKRINVGFALDKSRALDVQIV